MKQSFKLLFAIAIFLTALSAHAGTDSGFYWGGSIGNSSLDISNTEFDAKDSGAGYKLIGGFNFGWVPTMDFAVELDYRDFGSFEYADGLVETDMTSFDLYGIFGFNFGPGGLFVKYGYSDGDIDSIIDDVSVSGSDSATTWGLGAKVALSSITVRAEYEAFDYDDFDDLHMISLGVTLTF